MRRWIAIVLFVGVVAVGWRVFGARGRTAEKAQVTAVAVPVEVSPVETRTLNVSVSAAGTIEAIEDVIVSSKISGRVITLPVKEGDAVRAGQVVARLEGSDQAAQVRQAQGALQAAEARLRMLERGPRPQERELAANAVAQAKANYDNAQVNLARMQSLYAAGAIGKAQLDAAQLQAEVALKQYDAARQQWSMTETGARPEELDMARAQVTQAQAALAYAQLQLGNTIITSPLTGTVTHRFVDPGVVLSIPGQMAVVRVAQIDTVYAVLDVSEADLSRVRVGQAVRLRMDAYPDKDFTGSVREISQTAEGRSRVFKVKVLVSNPGHVLKPGMFARAEIAVARHDNAMVIPRDAVIDQGGESAVFVDGGSVARLQKVRVGIISGPLIEVLDGLRLGDRVIISGQSGLTDGTAITVR